MAMINCTEKCAHQIDGKCHLDHVIAQSANASCNQCVYFQDLHMKA
ncbi:MAG: hydroxymyristoyl-ACP dehydratase [Hyphomonadaceae bacterium]|nr:hydroxymyristoyl-ACP dehydratase [Clostridia bacterium]